MDTCWCGHEATSHDYVALDFFPSPTGMVTGRRGGCRAEWTERDGRDLVYCNCEQYAPERTVSV